MQWKQLWTPTPLVVMCVLTVHFHCTLTTTAETPLSKSSTVDDLEKQGLWRNLSNNIVARSIALLDSGSNPLAQDGFYNYKSSNNGDVRSFVVKVSGAIGVKVLLGLIALIPFSFILLPLLPLLPFILPWLLLLLRLVLPPCPVVPAIPVPTAPSPTTPAPVPSPALPNPLCADGATPDCTMACSDGEAVTCTCDGLSTTPICLPALCTIDNVAPLDCTCVADGSMPACALTKYRYRRPSGREMALGLEMENRSGNVTAKVGTNGWGKRISNRIVEGAGYVKHHFIKMGRTHNSRISQFEHPRD